MWLSLGQPHGCHLKSLFRIVPLILLSCPITAACLVGIVGFVKGCLCVSKYVCAFSLPAQHLNAHNLILTSIVFSSENQSKLFNSDFKDTNTCAATILMYYALLHIMYAKFIKTIIVYMLCSIRVKIKLFNPNTRISPT